MPRWMDYCGDSAIVLLPEDLGRAADLIERARELWRRDYRDGGSAVLGSGVGVLWLPRRCRKPRERLIIDAPGQGGGGASIGTPINYLARHGIAAFQVYGTMD